MKSIIKFAVSNPVTICMLVLAILLLGKISYDQLAVDLLSSYLRMDLSAQPWDQPL